MASRRVGWWLLVWVWHLLILALKNVIGVCKVLALAVVLGSLEHFGVVNLRLDELMLRICFGFGYDVVYVF